MYSRSDFGANYFMNYTLFRAWSPFATGLKVVIYDDFYVNQGNEYAMQLCGDGIWELKVPGDWKNKYYNLRVTIDGNEKEIPDPYAKGASVNGCRGMIVDFKSIDPKGWDKHFIPAPINPTEAVIYEMHVRDFSTDINSGMTHKGKFLAFTEEDTSGAEGISTGIKHLIYKPLYSEENQ